MFFSKRLDPWVEVNAAKKKGQGGPMVMTMVTDMVSTTPGAVHEDTEHDYESLARFGKRKLDSIGAQLTGSERVKMLGVDAVQVTGVRDGVPISIRLLHYGERRLELQCLGGPAAAPWPCDSAFTSFELWDVPVAPAASDTPRVLHLRDEHSGIEFDAPDDSWLAIGPRPGMGGAQVVWIWQKEERQIDVQAFDLSWAPATPDAASFAQKLADN